MIKLSFVSGCTIQGVFMLCLAYSGCNYTAAIIFLSAAVAVNGAVSTGPLASLVDISPNYASKYFKDNISLARTGLITLPKLNV